jgi:hypothetical protein
MKRVVLILFVAALSTAPGLAANFYPISSVTSSTAASDLFPVGNLIQGPGVGIAAAEPHDKILSDAAGNWVTAACGFPCDYIATTGMPVLTFDLGADVALTEVSTWGYNSSNANGVKEFSLKFATQAEGTGGFGTSILFNPTYTVTTIRRFVRATPSDRV